MSLDNGVAGIIRHWRTDYYVPINSAENAYAINRCSEITWALDVQLCEPQRGPFLTRSVFVADFCHLLHRVEVGLSRGDALDLLSHLQALIR